MKGVFQVSLEARDAREFVERLAECLNGTVDVAARALKFSSFQTPWRRRVGDGRGGTAC